MTGSDLLLPFLLLCGLTWQCMNCDSVDSSVLDYILQELDSVKGKVHDIRNERKEDKRQIAELAEQLRVQSDTFDNFRNTYKHGVKEDKRQIAKLNEQLRVQSEQFDNFRNTYEHDVNENLNTDKGTNVPLMKEGGTVVKTKHGKMHFINKLVSSQIKFTADSTGASNNTNMATSTNNTATFEDEPGQGILQRRGNRISKRLLIDGIDSTDPGTQVAFSSYISFVPTDLGNEHTIPFDTTISNVGGAFDTVLHAFICPVNGMYFFHSALTSVYQGHIETELVKDGVSLARMYAAGVSDGSAHGYDQGSNAVVTACDVDEHVWVRIRGTAGTTLSHDEFTTFSGFLLFTL